MMSRWWMNARWVDLAYALGLIWLLLVSVLCLAPMTDSGVSVPYADKLVHLLLFALGGMSIALLPLPGRLHATGLLLLIALGGLLEGLQAQTGLRHPEWADFLADSAGALAGVLITRKILRHSAARLP